MKIVLLAAMTLLTLADTFVFAQGRDRPQSCSEAYERCLRPRSGGSCDAVCQSGCQTRKAQCMTSGRFSTRNNQWTGLAKQ
jgi:hypothetical protein